MKSKSGHSHRWKHPLRSITYLLLTVCLADYFLVQPAHIAPADLPPPEPFFADTVQHLSQHVHFLASPDLAGRKPGTPGNLRAEDYIRGEFEHLDLVPLGPNRLRTQFIAPGIGSNVFSALGPVQADREWLVLGAHFDHLGEENGDFFLGADDNASGVAILLETARLARKQLHLQHYNLLFVAFNSEESPYFLTQWMGSHHFIHHLEDLGLEANQIASAVVMDLMGGIFWKPLRDTVFVMGSEKSVELESVVHSVSIPGLSTPSLGMHMIESIPGTGSMIFSDYQVFREHSIPWLFLSSGRTPDYHRPTDTANRLHYPRMARTVQWLLRYFELLDGSPRPVYDAKRETYNRDLHTLHPLIRKAASWGQRVPQTGWITFYKLQEDAIRFKRIQEKLEGGPPLDEADARTMSLASIRLQCLLGNMGPCFALPGQAG